MEAALAATTSNASDDSHEIDVNHLYLEVVGGPQKRRVYGLGSQALTLYPDNNSATSGIFPIVPDHAVEFEKRGVAYERKSRENSSTTIRRGGAKTRRARGLAFEERK